MRRRRDWTAVNANLEVGRAQRWEILRDRQRREFEVTPERADLRNRLTGGYVSYTVLALIGLAVGLFVGFRRPRDAVALIAAWFIATASIAFGLPNGWAVAWHLGLRAVSDKGRLPDCPGVTDAMRRRCTVVERTVRGNLVEAYLAGPRETKADVVVLGSEHPDSVLGELFSTTGGQILRRMAIPLVVVPPVSQMHH